MKSTTTSGVTFRKLEQTARAYGRGMDNRWQSGKYGVFVGGDLMGRIWSDEHLAYESSVWKVDALGADGFFRTIKCAGSYREAREMAARHWQ
jgi:hypothetical protein